jgi:ABC-type branched-subunit amino acid transport system permease subunit
VLVVLGLLICAVLPFVLSEYEATLAGFVGIAAIAALGLVLLTGVSGQTSFGHATFVGLAAYTSACLSRYGGYPPLVGLAAGLVLTGGTAFLLGLITSRISGHYLPLATIAWCASFFYLFGVIPGLGGFNGFGEIPPLFPGITRGVAAGVTGLVLVGATVLAANLLSSRTGRAMRALAQSRIMAESLGIDTARLARSSFVLAALLAGVAGWLFAHIQRYVSPAPFGLSASIEYVFMVVIGGGCAAARPVDRPAAAAAWVHRQFRDRGVQPGRHSAAAIRAARDRPAAVPGACAGGAGPYGRSAAGAGAAGAWNPDPGDHRAGEALRRPDRGALDRPVGACRRDRRADRPERGGQKHDVQPDQRGAGSECRQNSASGR